MTLNRARCAVVAIAIGGWLMATGCSSLKVDVDRDAAIVIPPGSTWAGGPEATSKRPEGLDPRVNNSIIHGRVQQAVETVLAQKGFRRADVDSADFFVAYRVGVKDARQVVTQAVTGANGSEAQIQKTVTNFLQDLP